MCDGAFGAFINEMADGVGSKKAAAGICSL